MTENDNILSLDRSGPAADAPAQVAPATAQSDGLYPLDWDTTTVKLKEGRFRHRVRRPTAEEIFERDAELQSDVPIGKDGSFSMPDPTANEDVDARLYDKLIIEATGYSGEIPAAHKSAVISGLYLRETAVPEDADPFADEVPVLEEIGQGDEPDFTIVHVMRQPAESELKRFRRRSSSGEIKPGKRGKQRFVTRSTLKNAVEHYDLWLARIEGARLDHTPGYDQLALKNAVDPLIKRQVVQALVDAVVGSLLD